jgi:molybdopterin-guanine dinucleotide biosynthesis protein A
MVETSGFVTAGGLSSRMAKDKAWLDLGGQSMIERVIAALTPVSASVSIIANDPVYSQLGLPVFIDKLRGIGPLEAIRTALTNTRFRQVLLVGCDLPFVTSELFRYLLRVQDNSEIVVPVGPDEQLEPLCAIYCQTVLPRVEELIESGERKVRSLFAMATTRFVAFNELQHLHGSDLFFENVNTPSDYSRAQEKLQWCTKNGQLTGGPQR